MSSKKRKMSGYVPCDLSQRPRRASLPKTTALVLLDSSALRKKVAKACEQARKKLTSATAEWVEISVAVTTLVKPGWPGKTGGITCDPSSGNVFLVIPDQGIRHGHDLSLVGRIRENLLIACHGGVETHLATGRGASAKA